MVEPKLAKYIIDGNELTGTVLGSIDEKFLPATMYNECPQWTNTFTRDFSVLIGNGKAIDAGLPGVWGKDNAVRDDAFMSRMITSYMPRRVEHGWRDTDVDIWNPFSLDAERTLGITVCQGDLDLCYTLFNNMYGSILMHGIQQGPQVEFWLRNYSDVKDWVRLCAYDCLLGFLEFMGIIGVQNPEQGKNFIGQPYDEALHLAFQRLDKWGYPNLQFPTWQGNLYGLKTGLGLVDARMFQALYQAIKIARRLQNNRDAPICEIGGGSGYVIYWLYCMGFRDLTLVDLPQVSLCQAWMLRQNIGADQIQLSGEPASGAPIKLLSPEEFKTRDYQLVSNSDSMPEMNKSILMDYLSHVQDHAQWFYSINQEAGAISRYDGYGEVAQQVVRSLIYKEFPKMQLIDRNVFWMRKGYTEEWYHMP